MKKINILYDATVVCNILENTSSRSGIFFVAYNVLLELLKREDFNVYLYADNKKKLYDVLASYSEFKDCKLYDYSVVSGLLCSLHGKKIELKKSGSIVFYGLCNLLYGIVKKIDKTLANYNEFSGIDIYFSPMKAVPKFIAKRKKIKKYTILHDVIPLVNNYRQSPRSWFYKLVNSINSEDKYFANSLYTKQDFIEYVPKICAENISVIPLATGLPYKKITNKSEIERVKAKYRIPCDKKYIFSLCSLDPRKNLIFSIKNFLKFIEKNSIDDFIFVLGGAHFEDFKEILSKNIENLGDKQDKILRIGYVDDEDMSALYSGAEMFIYASLYEGFGMPILEAMQCELPVICSNLTSMPEVIGDCGIQINPHSDEELVAAIEKMYFDRSFRQMCIKKGLERSKLFTWQKCIDIIENKIKKDVNN